MGCGVRIAEHDESETTRFSILLQDLDRKNFPELAHIVVEVILG